MAVKYWKEFLKIANDEAVNRKLYYQTYIHRVDLNKVWTRDAILEGFTTTNQTPPPKEVIDDLVDTFHNEIARHKSKIPGKITPEMLKKEYAYALGGAKKAKSGVVLSASDTHLVTNPGTYADTILKKAATKVRTKLKSLSIVRAGDITSKLQYAHGEGAIRGKVYPKTTIGAMQTGERALNQFNSDAGYNFLRSKEGLSMKTSSLIKRETVAALRDFMQINLAMDIDIDEKVRNDKAEFSDTFTVYGSVKLQDTGIFKETFDKHPNDFEQGITKTYFDALAKHFRQKILANRKITKGEYESSPKGKNRMKNLTVKQMELSFERFLRNNPQFLFTSNATAPFKKEAKADHSFSPKKEGIKSKDGKRAKRSSSRQRDTQQARGPDLLKLKNLINAMLPDELLAQMELPRLRNRTGRFRNSAQVTDIRIGPRGGTEVDYTYQLNPYQTFEPGGAQGSTNRDPRALIGGTIREIAQDLIGAKFIKTRRV